MNNKIKNKKLGLIYAILIIVLFSLVSCGLNKNSITGFAVKDDKGTANETSSNETAPQTITNETIAEETVKEKEEKPQKNKESDIPPVWKSDTSEFILKGKTTIDLSAYFYDEDSDTLAYLFTTPDKVTVDIDNNVVTLTPTGNNFNATITFTATDGYKSTSKEVKLIVPEKLITISLAYKSGTSYDADDNGVETTTGIIDLSVENSAFNWNADESRLCTRWNTYSIYTGESTTICYGSEKCCNFVGLVPKRDKWNEVFYATYGQYGATLKNIISAQIIYVDYNLSVNEPFAQIYYSSWENLSADYYFANIDFKNVCVETCSLTGFNLSIYKLIFEIENATLNLDTLTYTIAEEVLPVTVNLSIKDNQGITTGSYQLYSGDKLVSGQTIEPDYYNIEITPTLNVIDKLVIENANITKPLSAEIGIDNVSREINVENVDVKKRYAVNLENLDFEKATLMATASANSLYKCRQWDYEREVCFGSWVKIKNLVANQPYTLVLTKDDPGFIEGDSNETINITPINVSVTEIALINNIPNITILVNHNATISLSDYFSNIDSAIFTYYKPDKIDILFENNIATIVPDKDFAGIGYAFITANKSNRVAVSNLFSINVVNATISNITPNLILKKKDFKLDEDIDLDFEYLTKEELVKENKWKDEFEVFEEKTEKTQRELESLGQKIVKKEKQNKKWQAANENIETFVYGYYNDVENINVEIEELREGKFKIKLPKQRAFRAGRYTLKLDLVKDGVTYSQEQNFTWGVLAINVNKSIYLPNEDSFISIAVLDDLGHMVCNADVTLEIINPSNQKTILTTANNGIKISPECGYYGVTNLPDYYTSYSVNNVGTYIMNLTAVTFNGIRTITDNFTVSQNVDFDVARKSATRIYPAVPYLVNISIIANKNYNGIINEYVPAGFDISEVEFYEIAEQNKPSGIKLSASEDIEINKNLIENKPKSIINLDGIEKKGFREHLTLTSLNDIPILAEPGRALAYQEDNNNINNYLNVSFFDETKECKGRVAQWIEHLSHSREDAGSNFERKSRRAHTDSFTILEKEEKQARSLDKEPVSLTGISHEFYLDSETAESHTVSDKEQSDYLNVSVLNKLNKKEIKTESQNLEMQSGSAVYPDIDYAKTAKYINISVSNEENEKEKSGSHSLAIEPYKNLYPSRINYIKENLFKYLSVLNETTKLGSHSLAIAPDLRSGILRGYVGSNSLSDEMNFPPPASISSLEFSINKDLIKNKISNFFNLLPSAIAESSPYTINTVNDTKIISIPANLKKGSKYVVSYKFDAPDVSPEFYVLGPLDIGNFKEARQWQIAADAAIVLHGVNLTAPLVNITYNLTNSSINFTMTCQTGVAGASGQLSACTISYNFSTASNCAPGGFTAFSTSPTTTNPVYANVSSRSGPNCNSVFGGNILSAVNPGTIWLLCAATDTTVPKSNDSRQCVKINVTDVGPPKMNSSISNNTYNYVFGSVVNVTANVSDNFNLSMCQFVDNQSLSNGAKTFFNYTANGQGIGGDQCSQNYTIALGRGNVINFTVIVNDTSNNKNLSINSTSGGTANVGILITVNNTMPQQVRILFPINGSVTGNNSAVKAANLDINITYPGDPDGDIINITYYINGKLNQTTTAANTTLNLSDGAYILNVSIWDNVSGSTPSFNVSINFTIDTTPPAISTRSPSNNSAAGTSVTFSFTGTNANPYAASLWFNRTGVWKINQTLNFTNNALTSFNATLMNETFIYWAIFVNDTAGNFNFTQNFSLIVDNVFPRMNSSISNNTYNYLSGMRINVTANVSDDIGLSFCQFVDNGSLPNGQKTIFNKSVTGTNDQCSQNYTINLVRGNVINFTVIVNDTSNNINQSINSTSGGKEAVGILITVNNTMPQQVSILFPLNGSVTRNQPLDINITFPADADGDVLNISYYINGILNQTSLTNTTLNASDGAYILNISIFDNVSGSTPSFNVSINFTIDTTPPAISTRSPANNSLVGASVTFSFTATDASPFAASLWFNRTGVWKINQTLNFTNNVLTSFNATLMNETFIYWAIFVNDTASNSNFTNNFSLRIDSDVPIANTSFNISLTNIKINDVLNTTCNVSDETGLSFGNISYNFSTGNVVVNFTGLSGTSTMLSNATSIPVGRSEVVNITCSVTDAAGNTDMNDTVITIANTPPQQVRILFPLNGSVTGNKSVISAANLDLNVTFPADADLDVLNISYYINGVLNQTGFANTTLNLSDGAYILNVSIFDNVSGSTPSFNVSINFTIDTTPPAISTRSPANNSLVGASVTFSFTATDASPFAAQLWFNRTGVWKINQTLNFTNGAVTSFNATPMNDTFIYWAIIVNDTAGNTNFTENFSLIVDNVLPRINASLNNITPFLAGMRVNMTTNVSDETGLSFCQFIENGSLPNGQKTIFNKTVTGTNDQCSQNYTITLVRGNVINFTVIVNDTANNINISVNRSDGGAYHIGQIITVQNTLPQQVRILFPINGSVTGNKSVISAANLDLNVTFPADADLDVLNISYYINGVLNQTGFANTTLNLSDGAYILNVSIFDNVSGSTPSFNVSINFTIDTTPPAISTRSPANNSIMDTNVNFSFTATDANPFVAQLWFNRTGVWKKNQTLNFTNGVLTSFNLTPMNDTFIYWAIVVNDTAGNSNFTQNFSLIIGNTPPIVNTSLNKSLTNVFQNDIINLTANVTDETGLSFCQFIDNQSLANGAKTYFNKTVTETNDQCSQNYTIRLAAGDVINFTVRVNDTSNNFKTNDTIITVATSVSNTAPVIILNNVTGTNPQFSVDPISGGQSIILISFNVTDVDGVATINATKAIVNLTLGTPGFSQFRFNVSDNGAEFGTCFNHTQGSVMIINCTVLMQYYDNASSNWVINVSVQDTSGAVARNDTLTFTYNTVSALSLPYTSINFSSVTLGQQNVLAYPHLLINNTGNDDFGQINMSGANLTGTTTTSENIAITNFGVNLTNSSANLRLSFPANGILSLVDPNGAGNATLLHGHTSAFAPNADKGNISAFIWVNVPASGLSSQLYNATWNVTAVTTP